MSLDRRWGLLPLATFGWTAVAHVAAGTPHDILWICNVSALLLASAMLARWSLGLRVAGLWLWLGMPLWLADAVHTGEFAGHSLATHFVLPMLAVLAWPVGQGRPKAWPWALLLHLVVIVFCRFATPNWANVNLVHGAWGGQRWVYPQALPLVSAYFAATAVALAAVEFGLGVLAGLVARRSQALRQPLA